MNGGPEKEEKESCSTAVTTLDAKYSSELGQFRWHDLVINTL